MRWKEGVPRGRSALMVGGPLSGARPNRMFDLLPDGERFVLTPATKPPDDHLTFVFHFFEQLRRTAALTQP